MTTRDTSFLDPRPIGDVVKLYDIAHRPGFALHESFEGSLAWYRKNQFSVTAGVVPYSEVDKAKSNLFPCTYIVDKDGKPVPFASKSAVVRPPLMSAPMKMVLGGLRDQPYGNYWTNPTPQQKDFAADSLKSASVTAVFQVLEMNDFQSWVDEASTEEEKTERTMKALEIVKESEDAFKLMEKASDDYERKVLASHPIFTEEGSDFYAKVYQATEKAGKKADKNYKMDIDTRLECIEDHRVANKGTTGSVAIRRIDRVTRMDGKVPKLGPDGKELPKMLQISTRHHLAQQVRAKDGKVNLADVERHNSDYSRDLWDPEGLDIVKTLPNDHKYQPLCVFGLDSDKQKVYPMDYSRVGTSFVVANVVFPSDCRGRGASKGKGEVDLEVNPQLVKCGNTSAYINSIQIISTIPGGDMGPAMPKGDMGSFLETVKEEEAKKQEDEEMNGENGATMEDALAKTQEKKREAEEPAADKPKKVRK